MYENYMCVCIYMWKENMWKENLEEFDINKTENKPFYSGLFISNS